MKKMTYELSYPGASLESVVAMLGDPAFREAVCAAQDVVSQTVTITPEGDEGKRVVMEQVQETDGVPGFAKKIVGDRTTVVSTEVWSSATEGVLTVEIPGKPGEMSGTVRLVEDAAGITEVIDLDISVGIPLVGGKIEGLLGDLMGKAMATENTVGLDWLSR